MNYGAPCHAIGHQVLVTQPLPKGKKDFLTVDKSPKDVPLPTCLDY